MDFSGCAVADRAIWVAYQDGAGAWIVVTGVNDVYSFNITTGKGGLTYVVQSGGNTQTTVSYMTQAEFTAGTLDICPPPPPAGKTVNGTAAGITATGSDRPCRWAVGPPSRPSAPSTSRS